MADPVPRRSFVEQLIAIGCGVLALATPLVAAVAALFDPLRHGRGAGGYVLVTAKDVAERLRPGVPELFPVLGTEQNAWNSFPNQPLGTIYLMKDEKGGFQAFQSICPHQGCQVEFQPTQKRFFCPCHQAVFSPDGVRSAGPQCRDLDALNVKVENNAVLVEYKRFQSGLLEKTEL